MRNCLVFRGSGFAGGMRPGAGRWPPLAKLHSGRKPNIVNILETLLAIAAAIVVIVVVIFVFPALSRLYWFVFLRGLYSFKGYHAERIPRQGGVLILCNHASYIDWMALWLAGNRRMRFVLWTGYFKIPVVKWILRIVRHRLIPLDNRTGGPKATADALAVVAASLDEGDAVVYFPEGRLTRNGQMRPFGRGLERILTLCRQPVAVVPACTSGLWGTFYSHKGGKILRRWPDAFRRRVCVWFGKRWRTWPLPRAAAWTWCRSGT
jgi:acyl-[acyl-carrier-protein]-phospholipid O-acyltransferase / long-chain-fatty-acid--[acyl-carrier-protein] ligase